jgi:hypothetical protein
MLYNPDQQNMSNNDSEERLLIVAKGNTYVSDNSICTSKYTVLNFVPLVRLMSNKAILSTKHELLEDYDGCSIFDLNSYYIVWFLFIIRFLTGIGRAI